jgi:hypothetical protein
MSSVAQEVPKFMRDGIITVKLKDGREYKFSTNEWMVVRRGKRKLKEESIPVITVINKAEIQKNRITVRVGSGLYGLQSSSSANVVKIREERKAIFGLGYSRKLNEDFSLGASILSNESVTLDLGLDY